MFVPCRALPFVFWRCCWCGLWCLIDFGPFSVTLLCVQPCRLKFCHGKLYVASAYANGNRLGGIHEYTLDSNYEVVSSRMVIPTPQPYTPPSTRSSWSILGMTCDPRDTDDDWKLYFSLSPLYSQGGEPPNDPAPYDGAV